MSDMKPMHLGGWQEDWGPKKQLNYEQKMLKQLLYEMFGGNSMMVANAIRMAGDDFGWGWFNERFPTCPVAMGSRRLDDPISVSLMGPKMVSAYKKTEHYKAFNNLQQDSPDNVFHALVFDYHGDDVTDMVLHNAEFLADPSAFTWQISFRPDGNSAKMFLVSWKEFLARLSTKAQLTI